MGLADHGKERQLLRLAVDHPMSVEYLVTAVLGIRLREHGQLDIGRVASQRVEVLEQIATMGHEVPRLMMEYRELSKLQSTYVDALPGYISSNTGRVHTTFNQTGAATGRLSSSDPNLQNIPVRTKRGGDIRRALTAPPGGLLLTAAYSLG